ncbi:DUF418 domain-containing protein [uncultured Cyclobacterium sp.]|uniref:DUF418 domain-containing protein n=1 Tax=uncultured Cyclobacterium sp. TaxID=453820 RepID=UPI0030EF19C6|tara:strand:- start:12051 stop:13316 length:1266 start_codon:yes stop_codon:yes gene_type:complete
MSTSIKATESSERISSLDFLRGIAILGILFINIENFAYPDPWSPWKFGFEGTIDYSTRFWVYFLSQGKFYTMFALLFGVGFYIFLERLEKKQLGLKAMDIYARRLLWLFIIGVIHSYFIWTGDVLYHYAICGFLLFPFRSFKTKSLLFVIAFLSLLQLAKSYDQTMKRKGWQDNYTKAINLPEDQRSNDDIKNINFWKNQTKKKDPDTSKVEANKSTYLIGLKETYKNSSAHKGLVYYQGLLFPSLIAMILGIIFYRSGIFQNYQVWKYYWLISLVILGVGLIINYLRYYHWTYEYFEPVTNIWKGWLFTFPKELLGVGFILIFNGLFQKFLRSSKITLISKVGRTALTNYILQNTLLGLIFYGYGLSLFNQFSRFELLGLVVIIWIIQLTLSWLWLRKFQQGPLEWLWRKLTYSSFKHMN